MRETYSTAVYTVYIVSHGKFLYGSTCHVLSGLYLCAQRTAVVLLSQLVVVVQSSSAMPTVLARSLFTTDVCMVLRVNK
jgi:hypothetical protein